jgi:hypothetical protein
MGMAVLALAFGFVAAGCVSSGKTYVYDKTVPVENLCELFLGPDYSVSRFDGQKVDWEGMDTVKIPAGEHTLGTNYSNTVYEFLGPTTVSTASGTLTYDFQIGRRYTLAGLVDKGNKTVTMQNNPQGLMYEYIPPSEITNFEGKWKWRGGDNDYFVFRGNEYEAAGLAKGFFVFTDTQLIFEQKWQRADAMAEWQETPETIKIGSAKIRNTTSTLLPYQFDDDSTLLVNLQTYRKVDE